MNSKPSLKSIIIPLVTLMLFLFLEQPSYSNQSPLETAARRSQNAAKAIKVVTGMPEDETIPTELFNRAYAIGVFPDVDRMNLLFTQGIKGYGVICSRQPEGWSLPAYYGFGSVKFGSKIAAGKSFDVIMLFMDKEIVDWFQKGRLKFEGANEGIAGPVGKLSPQGGSGMSWTGITIIYLLVDGKLKGIDLESDILQGAALNPDNNLNQVLYGMKGREVLQGKAPKSLPTTPELMDFRDILNEKFRSLSN